MAGKGEGYDGGHLGAHRFFGDTPDAGIAPQKLGLNRGAYSTLENEWSDWTKNGYEVEFEVDVQPPGSIVPEGFDILFEPIDTTGRIKIDPVEEYFPNRSGVRYDRTYLPKMPNRGP